jgi:hypothetical protein
MRPLFLAIPVSLLLSAPDGLAQPQDYPLASAGPGAIVEGAAPAHTFRVTPGDTDAIRGTYDMSNGWTLTVRPAYKGIVAAIGRQRPMYLFAIGPGMFATADGNVAMEFDNRYFGTPMTMHYVPASRVARVIVTAAGMAAR